MPQRELIGPNAPEEAARPLTGTEVLHVVDEDGNSKVTTTAAIAEDLGSGGAPAAHAASHATAGDDPITPASIGAATVAEAGNALTAAQNAQTDALDAKSPLVQTAHTSSTKTLAAGDAGQVIPLSGASNAIAITVPHSLFGAAGAGRAFVCQFKVLSVAGGALSFVGSGGIVVTYSGKNPSSSAYAAGDYLTLVVDSATTARVFAAAAV